MRVKKSLLGSITIVIAGLFLALQLYGLKWLQIFEKHSGSWTTYARDYIWESPVKWSLCITCAVIIYGIILVVKNRD